MSPAVRVGHARHEINESAGISGTGADASHAHGQRQVGVDVVPHRVPQARILSVENRRRVGHGNLIGGGAELQAHIQPNRAKSVHHHVFLHERLEPGGRDGDAVFAGRERREDV